MRERHDREALGLGLAQQLVDLAPVEQQLAGALWLVVEADVRRPPRGDMEADDPGLVALDARVGVREAHLLVADALDLRAAQHDAGLEGVLDAVVVAGSSVPGDGVAHRGTPLAWVHGRCRTGDAGSPDARTPARCRAGVRGYHHPKGRTRPISEVVQRCLLSITAHHLLSFPGTVTDDPDWCKPPVLVRTRPVSSTSSTRPANGAPPGHLQSHDPNRGRGCGRGRQLCWCQMPVEWTVQGDRHPLGPPRPTSTLDAGPLRRPA